MTRSVMYITCVTRNQKSKNNICQKVLTLIETCKIYTMWWNMNSFDPFLFFFYFFFCKFVRRFRWHLHIHMHFRCVGTLRATYPPFFHYFRKICITIFKAIKNGGRRFFFCRPTPHFHFSSDVTVFYIYCSKRDINFIKPFVEKP